MAVCYAFGRHLTGDTTAAISMLDDTVGTEADGSPILRIRVPPALLAEDGARVFVDRFELECQHGLGTATGQGADPVAMLKWSKDFGQTWGNERQAGLGKQGETDKRTYWLKCGSADTSMVPEVRISDPIPTRIVGALVNARGAQARKAAA